MRTIFGIVFVATLGAFIGYVSAGGDPRKVGISDEVADRGEEVANNIRSQLKLAVTDARLLLHLDVPAQPPEPSKPNQEMEKPAGKDD